MIRTILPMLAALVVVSSSLINAARPATQKEALDFARLDLHNRQIELKQFRGKTVLLNFWATWCAPCLSEIPSFIEWQKQWGPRKFQVLGVSLDDSKQELAAASARLGINYPVVMADEKLAAEYGGILGLPLSLVIDPDGRIRTRYEGVNLAKLKASILASLSSSGTKRGE
jgi:cytochrome c biogenesis protein CcmG/thiol:disulfide interchange protein DsbE